MEEIWKEIPNIPRTCYASSLGNIKVEGVGTIPYYINNKGYALVSIYFDGKTHHYSVHRLIAIAFIPNPSNLPQVNHIDGNKLNNQIANLEWCNQRHNYDEGMKQFLYSKNEDHFYAKLKNSDIYIISELYKLGFTRALVAKIMNVNHSSLEAIEKGISYRELGIDFKSIKRTRYKSKFPIVLPKAIYNYLKDNTVLNTLISEGKVLIERTVGE